MLCEVYKLIVILKLFTNYEHLCFLFCFVFFPRKVIDHHLDFELIIFRWLKGHPAGLAIGLDILLNCLMDKDNYNSPREITDTVTRGCAKPIQSELSSDLSDDDHFLYVVIYISKILQSELS